jgi:molybdate transport system permease protein
MLVGITKFKTETLPGCMYLNISTGNNELAMATAMIMLILSGLVLVFVTVLNRKKESGRFRGEE